VVHVNAGNPYLSGSAACHWYFNHDIPDATMYYNRYAIDPCVEFNLTLREKMVTSFWLR
jgi:hypothetical protein